MKLRRALVVALLGLTGIAAQCGAAPESDSEPGGQQAPTLDTSPRPTVATSPRSSS